jgi:hypothetical protein
LIETIDSGIDVVLRIDSFQDDLLEAGFADVSVENAEQPGGSRRSVA